MPKSNPFKLFAGLLLLSVALSIGACKPEEPADTTPPVPETSITIICKDSAAIEGVRVGIALAWQDCNNNRYLYTRTTDGFGKAKFESLDPGTYCFVCTRNQLGVETEVGGEIELSLHERASFTAHF